MVATCGGTSTPLARPWKSSIVWIRSLPIVSPPEAFDEQCDREGSVPRKAPGAPSSRSSPDHGSWYGPQRRVVRGPHVLREPLPRRSGLCDALRAASWLKSRGQHSNSPFARNVGFGVFHPRPGRSSEAGEGEPRRHRRRGIYRPSLPPCVCFGILEVNGPRRQRSCKSCLYASRLPKPRSRAACLSAALWSIPLSDSSCSTRWLSEV